MNSKDAYKMELEAELGKLKLDQDKHPTEYKAQRIRQLESRLEKM